MSQPQWVIGMTTAPRARLLIDQSIDALLAAGWELRDIVVQAEPDSPATRHAVGTYIQNQVRLGAWNNWILLLQYLQSRRPDADYYAIVQDDVSIWRGLRAYLEESFPADKPAIFQPYTSPLESRRNQKWYRCMTGRNLCGAHFFVFTRAVIGEMLRVLPERVPENKHIDGYVAQACNDHYLPFYQHIPSLVQHLGDDLSTLGYQSDPTVRVAPDFIGVNGELPQVALEEQQPVALE